MAYPPTQNGNLLLCLQEGDLTAQEKLLAGIPIRNKNKTISKKSAETYSSLFGHNDSQVHSSLLLLRLAVLLQTVPV
jgi:hypothetical protein